ncbi:MAG: dephospho-CoA kinase [Flavobacteriales bacterium]|nr:dephospho-CoA kinase [Flavobacteriales bacterium]
MLKVGLTGGIGSGKTTVSEVFHSLGIPVYNSDKRAKYLMENDSSLRVAIIQYFGEESYRSEGLNRLYLSEQVFSDKSKLQKLNSIVHPVVGNDFALWCKNQSAPFVLKEAAILIESGAYKGLDKIIVVTASENVRMERVMERDGVKASEVRDRINNQMTDSERLQYADFIIDNDGIQMLISQVKEVFNKLNDSQKM